MTVNERAAQVAPLLVYAAKHRHIITYDEVWYSTGMNMSGLGKVLEVIKDVCEKNDLPPLTMIVVKKYEGQSTYFKNDVDYHKNMMNVYNYDWYNLPIKFIDEIMNNK